MTDGPTTPSPSRPESTGVPWWKQRRAKLPTWAWIVLGLVVVLIAIIASSGSDDDTDGSDTNVATTETVVEVAPTAPADTAVGAQDTAPPDPAATTEVPDSTAAASDCVALTDDEITALVGADGENWKGEGEFVASAAERAPVTDNELFTSVVYLQESPPGPKVRSTCSPADQTT